jgi:hypothetical protein
VRVGAGVGVKGGGARCQAVSTAGESCSHKRGLVRNPTGVTSTGGHCDTTPVHTHQPPPPPPSPRVQHLGLAVDARRDLATHDQPRQLRLQRTAGRTVSTREVVVCRTLLRGLRRACSQNNN